MVLFAEAGGDGVEGCLLCLVERIDVDGGGVRLVQPPHFMLVRLEDALLRQSGKGGRGGVGACQQLLPADLAEGRGVVEEARQLQVLHQQGELLGGACQFVEQRTDALLRVKSFAELHPCLGLGLVAAFQLLLDVYRPFGKQAVDHRKEVAPRFGVFLQLGDALFGVCRQLVEHLLFADGEGDVRLVVGVEGHDGLALQLHARRKCRLVDVAGCAEIVRGNPLPQTELSRQEDGVGVEHLHDILYLIAGGRVAVDACDECRVELLASEGHNDAAALGNLSFKCFGKGIGVAVCQGQRQDDIDVKHGQKGIVFVKGETGGRHDGGPLPVVCRRGGPRPFLFLELGVADAGVVDRLQLLLEERLDGGNVLEGDGAFAEEAVRHLGVDDFIDQSVDALLGVLLQAV